MSRPAWAAGRFKVIGVDLLQAFSQKLYSERESWKSRALLAEATSRERVVQPEKKDRSQNVTDMRFPALANLTLDKVLDRLRREKANLVHPASVLQKRRKSANIHACSGVIWGIPVSRRVR